MKNWKRRIGCKDWNMAGRQEKDMGKILIAIGIFLCLAGIVSLVLSVLFFGKQRERLIEQINNEYREA
ncbi:MAG: hypothetical protein OSJ53_04040 [Kineothrix sp.]|nr:hypothetical protein [Kineothrix sp.]